jgi:CRISPR-associated protein Csm4
MAYTLYRFTLKPKTAFGTPLVGDTLFGQMCWAIRHNFGEERLKELLQDYCKGKPFAVASDAFPHGFLPLPAVPAAQYWGKVDDADRKALKKKHWLPVETLQANFSEWQNKAANDSEAALAITQENDREARNAKLQLKLQQSHNTINRETLTTGTGMFAPYTQSQIWFDPKITLDLYFALDSNRFALEDLKQTLMAIGESGYGRDASVGLGKFELTDEPQANPLSVVDEANAYLTLAPAAPQGLGFLPAKSFYQPVTRFGRHGDIAVQCGNPFKRPVLMANAGAVFTPETFDASLTFIGQGISNVSTVLKEAVTQGYAPVIGIDLREIAK